MTIQELRIELSEYGKKLIESGLVTGAGGNISARFENVVLMSPSGFSLAECKPEDFVALDLESGNVIEGDKRPTSEYLMHLYCFRKRPDITAVVHCHPRYTVAVSSSGFDIKAMFADFQIYVGSNLPHIDYITVTTPELAKAVEDAVDDSTNVVVLRNHGAVTLGVNLKQAFYRMLTLEEGANIQSLAQSIGKPRFFTDEEKKDLENLNSEVYRRKLLSDSGQV